MASKMLTFKFRNSVTQNGAIQARTDNKMKHHENTCCNAPETSVAKRRSLSSAAGMRIQTEFRMRNLNWISPPTSPAADKRKINFQLWLLRWRIFSLNNGRREIKLYVELWDNGKRVTTWMQGEAWRRENTGSKQATPKLSECKHGS
jgi:hypothetical protein